MRAISVRSDAVFLNIPYDAAFEPLYLAYIVGLSGFHLVPHTALEIPGPLRRLDRIQNLLHTCRYSIHDLSRAEFSAKRPHIPRFNMPFELGLAVGWAHQNPRKHSWFVCDSKPHRVIQTISDLNGTDINVHDGTPEGVMRELCNMFAPRSVRPDVPTLMKRYRKLRSAVREIQKRAGARTLFEPRVFGDIYVAATTLTQEF